MFTFDLFCMENSWTHGQAFTFDPFCVDSVLARTGKRRNFVSDKGF